MFSSITMLILLCSVSISADQAFGPVSANLHGFSVLGMWKDATDNKWVIDVKYSVLDANTVGVLFLPMSGSPIFSDTFQASQNPCVESSSVCCLLGLKDNYNVGDAFLTDIENTLGACGTDITLQDTLDLFYPASYTTVIDNVFDNFAKCSIVRQDAQTIQIRLDEATVKNEFAVFTNTVNGYDLDFFVGFGFFTMLPAPLIVPTVSQVNIHISSTDTSVFSTASTQQYSILRYITISVMDTKSTVGGLFEYHPQSVKVSFLLSDVFEQNMVTGLVPLTSVRYSIAQSLPAADDPVAWKNPCFSSTDTGLWDPGVSNPLYSMYADANGQTCGLAHDLCTNPTAAPISQQHVDFWFPLGDGTITNALLQSVTPYVLYIYFDISVIDANGRHIQSRLFTQSTLDDTSLKRICLEQSVASGVSDVVDVSLAVGITGTLAAWDSTVREFNNILGSGVTDLSVDVSSASIQDALVTLILDGDPNVFNNRADRAPFLEIDSMVSLHFLDDTVYDTVKSALDSNSGWTLGEDAGDFSEITLSQSITDICNSAGLPGDMTCAIRYDITGRAVQEAYAVHALASGYGTSNPSADSLWIQTNLFGVSEYAAQLATDFTNLVRTKYAINDHYNKAWYLNPGYPWAAQAGSSQQSILSLSDKTIWLIAFTLDGLNTGRRMLMQVGSQGDAVLQRLQELDLKPSMHSIPPFVNSAVDSRGLIANAFGVSNGFGFLNISIELSSANTDTLGLRAMLQGSLQTRAALFAPTSTGVWIVQFKAHTKGKRRALFSDTLALDLLILLNFTTYNNTIFGQELRDAVAQITSNTSLTAAGQQAKIHELISFRVDALEAEFPEHASQWAHIEQYWMQETSYDDDVPEDEPIPDVFVDGDDVSRSGRLQCGYPWIHLCFTLCFMCVFYSL
eukprot:143875-Rhodomonas_salina.1